MNRGSKTTYTKPSLETLDAQALAEALGPAQGLSSGCASTRPDRTLQSLGGAGSTLSK